MHFFKAYLLVFILFISSVTAFAETFDDYLKAQMDDFQQFKDERDKEFSAFLKEMWIRVETEKPYKLIDEPKPIKIPSAPVSNKNLPPPFPSVDLPKAPITPEPTVVLAPEPEPVSVPVPPTPVVKGRLLEFMFFGTSVRLGYDPALKLGVQTPISGANIAEFWEKAALADYEPLINSLSRYKEQLKMTDWGFVLLVSDTAGKIAADKNGKVLLTWFILSKMGYNTRTAYDRESVFLLVPASTQLYGVSFFTLDNKRYYAISADGFTNTLGTVFTYEKSYPNAERVMDFRMETYPDLGKKLAERELQFTYAGKSYDIKVPYNMNDIVYLRYHPQTDVALYADAGLPSWAAKSLLQQLKPIIEGKSPEDAVNILLYFVQTAFKYATDEQQFGREKFMFAMETIYYPYSDCEDRSILFAYLVDELLGLKTVFLNFPGHIATAVHFKNAVKGDYVMYEGERYTIADPTFINATYGMTMPQFSKSVPKVIKFN